MTVRRRTRSWVSRDVDIGQVGQRAVTPARRVTAALTVASVFADYDELVVAFDARAARRYGSIVAERGKVGRPVTTADAQIAAICSTLEATLATRNTSDFGGTGIELVSPWDG